jgi:cellulose synthase/poly-beta-1,6-N-acetylglucosamine synthase-like glycosyltransferase
MAEVLLWVALAWVFYTFAGYPALIWAVARTARRTWQTAPVRARVAVVIVVHNEAERLRAKLDSCLAQDYPPELLRVVVVSDGSTDATTEIVRSYAQPRVTLLEGAERRGKAACLNDAVAGCSEEILVFTDARQRLGVDAVSALVRNFADPRIGAASGELMFDCEGTTQFGEGVDAYWRYEKFIRRHESAVHSVVGATGALYAVRRSAFQPVPPDTILDDVLIPMNVVRGERRVVFEGQARAFDRPAQRISEESRRKVRTLAGNFQLLFKHPWLLNPLANPVFFQFVSHKVVRLFAPYALVLAAVCSLILVGDGSTYAAALVAFQAACYGLALLGLVWPWSQRARAIRFCTTFLLLNWFAVLGLLHYLRQRDAHLWAPDRAAVPGVD